MPEVTLERVVEDVRKLTPAEQRQLQRVLDSWLAERHAEEIETKERLLAQHLLEIGLISHIPQRDDAQEGYERHPPIVVQGEPVSETVIRERR